MTDAEKAVVLQALEIMAREVAGRDLLTMPDQVRTWVQLRIGALEHEEVHVIYLDAQNRSIAFEPMFRGTLTQSSVHPREVAKRALLLNAAGVIIAHNHPSGVAEPSVADIRMTEKLKAALDLIDVRLLDHIIVSPTGATSLAERGLM